MKKNTLNKNIIYYTILNKKDLNLKIKKCEKEKLETLQSKFILKRMLNYFNIEDDIIIKTNLGKPYFKNINVFFNYSHSNNYIACAISNYEVGIDIEETDRLINNTMFKICKFNIDTSLEEFVKREAFCKLTGAGIASFFDIDKFKKSDKKNIIIKEKEYICSIYSNCHNPSFKSINVN